MRTVKIIIKAAIVALVITLSPMVLRAQEAAPFDGGNGVGNLVQFSFEKADWQDVIPWFAEQTGYSWQSVSQFPEGTFTLSDTKAYTPIEALDQLNYALRLQDPPYTLIRNRNQLILTEASSELPVELIPKVDADELDQRGDYELLSCQFDLGTLDVNDVEQDLMMSVDEKYSRYSKVLPKSNGFFARGTGADLKNIRNTIQKMTRMKTRSYSIYTLKYYDPEQFLIVARGPLQVFGEENARDDGTLSISVDPSSNRLIVNGTPAGHKQFMDVAKVVDVEPTEEEAGLEGTFVKNYAIMTDPEMAKKVVQTMLDGTTATIGQNDVTGAIVLRGTESHHKIAAEVIDKIQGEAGSTKIVELENATATDILAAVNKLLNISAATATDNPNAPRLLANTSQNFIVVHGSPQEIFNISGMIAKLDKAQGRDPNRIRTNARVIEMTPDKRDQMLETVKDYWPSTGRKNSLRIIMPDEKVKDKLENGRKTLGPFNSSTRVKPPSGSKIQTVAFQQIVLQPEAPPEAAPGSGTSSTSSGRYVPPTEVKSVPGAVMSIKATPFGVLIESDDLDALDDLEDIFRSQATDDGLDQGVTVFYLKFRKVNFVKSEIELMFGLASSSGGSGGGLMAGIADNMAGGGTGDLMSELLGGSSSSSSGAVELTGDVTIGQSVPLNLLYVSGATATDLNYIQDAIDLFDQPSAPQDPELLGQHFSIPIRHRSPDSVFNLISSLYPDYIAGGQVGEVEEEEGENGINQMAKMVRGMTGNGEEGGGGGAAAEEAPKARMSLDEKTGQIILVGPKFIYEQILELVKAIDTPDLSEPMTFEVLPPEYYSAGAMEIIKNSFGSKVAIVQGGSDIEMDSEGGGEEGRGRTAQGGDAKKANDSVQRQQQQAADFFRNIRRNGGGGGAGGGGGNRGGGAGGGGGNRGGGGGNRGGGGGGRR